ncbi:MAG: DUF4126 domain-containing protein [Gemmatimonadetes bacterium]|nr:DUF4126 domain-containing protein [Gemmatimonadota bacterium]
MIIALLTGIGLAACAGLRAFMPLFGLGAAARWMDLPLTDSVGWLASDTALVMFGIATLVELAADKVPVVDNVLDGIQTVAAPAAGILVTFGVLADLPAPFALALAIIAGAAVSGGVHAVAATTRVKSTAGTAGAANPVLSVIEDILAIGSLLVALLVPLLVLLVVVATVLWLRRRARRDVVARSDAP